MNKQLINDIILAATEVLIETIEQEEKRKKKPRYWVNPYLMERSQKGRFVKDIPDLILHPPAFYENFHMDYTTFENLFKLVEPKLQPVRNTRPFDRITPKEKFACVIEYLASGTIQRHMASIYRISKQYFGFILDTVCNAICEVLKSEISEMNKQSFVEVANGFNSRWYFPNCLGAVDGKHVALTAPKKSDSLFYNYKGYFSIVLMGVCDSQYRFTYIDIGAYGSEGDSNVFASSKFGQDILQQKLAFPANATVNGFKMPFFFIGDDAFPLFIRIMKPYGGKGKLKDDEIIFNYRLSMARQCIENAFGILSTKWLCLRRTMQCSPDRAQKIVVACCFLHNLLLSTNKNVYCPPGYADNLDDSGELVEGEWRTKESPSSSFSSLPSYRGRNSDEAKMTRENLKTYFMTPHGSVPWQNKCSFK